MIINPGTPIAKSELHYLMGSVSTDEERKDAFSRMVKIGQSSMLSITMIIDTIFGFVVAGCGNVDDALRNLERRYGICGKGNANHG